MGKVLFYQLTHSSAEDTARVLLGRALQMGWRVMIRGTDQAALQRMDARLWQGPPESFLPHGLEGGADDADQPVLLGQGPAVNQAKGVILIDSAAIDLEEAAHLERIWVLFESDIPPRLEAARNAWRLVTGAGLVAEYWAEEDGRWQKKAASGA